MSHGRALMWSSIAVALLVTGYLGWLRDSSVVEVEHVTVTGLTTRDAPKMRGAVEDAARRMTTLHVREDVLRDALAPYAVVHSLRAETSLPDRLAVHVVERRPAAAVAGASGPPVPVAADGTLLGRVRPRGQLAVVRSRATTAATRLSDPQAMMLVRVVARAPEALAARTARARVDGDRGIVISLRRGPELVFGDARDAQAKWDACARVLGAAAARGASYVDVRLPERPAAGGVGPPQTPPAQPQPTPEGLANRNP